MKTARDYGVQDTIDLSHIVGLFQQILNSSNCQPAILLEDSPNFIIKLWKYPDYTYLGPQ